jgi:hypothetical protein
MFGNNRRVQLSKIKGDNGLYNADVIEVAGVKRLRTDGVVQIEQLFGVYDFADNDIAINSVGNVGDTLTIEIDSINPQVPNFSKVFTTQIGEDRYSMTTRIVNELNSDVTFNPYFKARKIKDNSIVYIQSVFYAEFGENPTINSFRAITTGLFSAIRHFDNFKRQNKTNTVSVDSNDPRLGTLGISGIVSQGFQNIGEFYFADFKNGASIDMRVNGATTDVNFTIPAIAGKSIYIERVIFYASGNGIQFGKFLSRNQPLPIGDGVLLSIKSDNQQTVFPELRKTEDFKNRFAFGAGERYEMQDISGLDQMIAVFISPRPFPIKKIGSFGAGNDDFLKVAIRANLSSGLEEFGASIVGFTVEE